MQSKFRENAIPELIAACERDRVLVSRAAQVAKFDATLQRDLHGQG